MWVAHEAGGRPSQARVGSERHRVTIACTACARQSHPAYASNVHHDGGSPSRDQGEAIWPVEPSACIGARVAAHACILGQLGEELDSDDRRGCPRVRKHLVDDRSGVDTVFADATVPSTT